LFPGWDYRGDSVSIDIDAAISEVQRRMEVLASDGHWQDYFELMPEYRGLCEIKSRQQERKAK